MEKGSQAYELVDKLPPCSVNYQKSVDQLKTRLVLSQATGTHKGIQLRTFYDRLEAQLRSLETLGVAKGRYTSMLYPLVDSAIPHYLIRVWER